LTAESSKALRAQLYLCPQKGRKVLNGSLKARLAKREPKGARRRPLRWRHARCLQCLVLACQEVKDPGTKGSPFRKERGKYLFCRSVKQVKPQDNLLHRKVKEVKPRNSLFHRKVREVKLQGWIHSSLRFPSLHREVKGGIPMDSTVFQLELRTRGRVSSIMIMIGMKTLAHQTAI
jgi:hypothetical protein